MEIQKPSRRRRHHPEEFKQAVIEACCEPGASVAGIAMANGVNANQVRRWLRERGIEVPKRRMLMPAAQPDGKRPGVVLLDCVSLWVANLMAADMTERDILDRVEALAASIEAYPLPLALVSVEAGLGMVAMSSLGRRFQDTLGLANQALARVCGTVLFVSCGLPLVLKGQLPEEIC